MVVHQKPFPAGRTFSTILVIILLAASCQNDDAADKLVPPSPFEVEVFAPVPVAKSNSTQLFAHYMPWFQSESVDGYWGSHWTMANRNPNLIDANGRREIAAFYYPKIGPYSSKDPNLIEYHLLLMKYCGIDGFIIDWYGTHNVYDYPVNLTASNALIDASAGVGLSFAIDYEDRSTENVVAQGLAPTAVAAATADMAYIQTQYFSRANYIQYAGSDLLLVFTPVHIQTPAQWTSIFSAINPKPTFLTLWYESADAGINASGEYPWIYSDYLQGLQNFYSNRVPQIGESIGVAYPGFRDFYNEGGWGGATNWEIDHSNALTQTLALAAQYNQDLIQLATWNDFGEGTMLEPTEEFGFSFLETIQQFAGVTYTIAELELVLNLYQKRKTLAGNANAQLKLDQVYYYLISLQVNKAAEILGDLE